MPTSTIFLRGHHFFFENRCFYCWKFWGVISRACLLNGSCVIILFFTIIQKMIKNYSKKSAFSFSDHIQQSNMSELVMGFISSHLGERGWGGYNINLFIPGGPLPLTLPRVFAIIHSFLSAFSYILLIISIVI